MSWLASIFVGFLTAVIGCFGVGGLGLLCVEWFRVSNREGGSGYLVIFLGLLGGVAGFFVGLMCARIVAAGAAPTLLKALGVAAGASVGLVAIATLICWLAADQDTTLHGNAVELLAEIRSPVGFVIPSDAESEAWYAHIDTRSRRSTSHGLLRLDEVRQEDGRSIIPVTLVLNTSVREKLLYVRLAHNTQLFVPIFPSKPGSSFFSWSDWQDGGWEPGKPRPDPEQRFSLRFRLREVLAPELPPGPSDEEIKAAKEAEENAALASLTPNSPLEDCLKLTHCSQPEERRQKAGAVIGQRPRVVEEISLEILSADPEVSERALRALAVIKPLPAALAGPVGVVGDELVASMQRFNASRPEDDPHFQGAADASMLFNRWFHGHHALHNFAGVDGLPRITQILELALQRSDSYVMKNDVARLARYHVDEWSGKPAMGK